MTPWAQRWLWLVIGAAVTTSALAGCSERIAPSAWLAFALLALAATLAHWFPIMSALNGASFRLTNAFLVAGAVILPVSLVPLLPILAISTDAWWRRRPGWVSRWLFNLSQTILATLAASGWAHALSASAPDLMRDSPAGAGLEVIGLIGAALVFTLVQDLLVGMIIALNAGIPLRHADTLTATALQGDLMIGLIGSSVAGLWLARPSLTLLVVPLLLIAYRLTRAAHLAQLAQIDEKTRLPNFRRFELLLEEEFGRSQRLGRPLALLFLDLDHFKQINDRYGHDGGDLVLKQVADRLTTSLSSDQTAARFGGEEFVVLLPGTALDEALYAGERVRRAIAEHDFRVNPDTLITCTVSVGVALYPGDAGDPVSLIKQADTAMYRAKQRRNAVAHLASEPALERRPA